VTRQVDNTETESKQSTEAPDEHHGRRRLSSKGPSGGTRVVEGNDQSTPRQGSRTGREERSFERGAFTDTESHRGPKTHTGDGTTISTKNSLTLLG